MSKATVLSKSIGINNVFEDDVYIGEDVIIGNNNIFKKGSVIEKQVLIGCDNLFSNYVIIGCQGEMGLKGDIIPKDGKIEIGSNNSFREFVVVGFPAKTLITRVGSNNYFMARSHIPHDCIIGNNVVMAPNSVLGGGAQIEDYVFVGLGASTHHGVKLGEGSMIGMQAANAKSVPPFMTVGGVPSKIICMNKIGAERRGIDNMLINEVVDNLTSIINLDYSNSDNFMINKIQYFIKENKSVTVFS